MTIRVFPLDLFHHSDQRLAHNYDRCLSWVEVVCKLHKLRSFHVPSLDNKQSAEIVEAALMQTIDGIIIIMGMYYSYCPVSII